MSQSNNEAGVAPGVGRRMAKVGRYIFQVSFLRNILLACLLVALLLPVYNWLIFTPAYRQLLTRQIESEAERTAVHLMRVLGIGQQPLLAAARRDELQGAVDELKMDFRLEKLKVFDPSGRTIFSTDPAEVGTINTHDYFRDIVSKGRIYSHIVAKGERTLENQSVTRDVAEIYVPITYDEVFVGAFEIYYDVSASRAQMTGLLHESNLAVVAIALGMMVIVVAVLFKAGAAMLSHKQTDEALRRSRDELEQRVTERTADLSCANEELQQEIAERRQAEKALRASEARFRNLIETIPHGIREVDTDGVIAFVNPAHARIYGYSDRELLGTAMFDLVADAEERRQLRAHLDYVVSRRPHPNPWFSKDRTKDGRLIDTQVDWRYKKDQADNVTGLITVVSDITHHKQAEKALLDNITFMNTLIDTIPTPVFFKDEAGFFLGCNKAYADTVGLPKEKILGHRLIDLEKINFREMAERYHQLDMALIHSPGVEQHETHLLASAGGHRDYMLFRATFKDTEDQVAGLVGIMMDITERKQAEKDLNESQRLFNAFMEHLPGMAFIKDLQGHYLFANQAFFQFADIAPGSPIGMTDQQVWGDETADRRQANEQAVIAEKASANHEETVRLSSGRTRQLLTTRFPIFTDERLTAVGGIAIDITERNEAEHRRRQLERQLQQAQKMEALGTLAGGIAHDFNNILAAIIGYTQIALADIEPQSPVHKYIKRVLEAGERAGDLVKQILTFSRQREMEPTPVQISTIVKEVLKLVRATMPVTIEMVTNIDSDTMVMADPVQVHQVMMNLCANASYAMRGKSGKLTVTMSDVALDETFTSQYTGLKPGAYLKLSVADTGVGIAPEIINRIFDPFFTTKPKDEGTGMGLSVVHGIVANMGGVVAVESTLGRGATFDVYLPALADKAAAPVVGKKDPLPLGTERLLLVDDEIFQTDMLKHMLGLLGYKVQSCNRSVQALSLFEKDPKAFDLVITDMAMPEMSGETLTRRMLALRPDLPIIMSTGYSETIDNNRAKKLGVRAFTLKPLSMDDVARLIRTVLDEDTANVDTAAS